jgi:hypothetical protein
MLSIYYLRLKLGLNIKASKAKLVRSILGLNKVLILISPILVRRYKL